MERPWGVDDKVRFIERVIGPTLDWSVAPSGVDAESAGRPVARICSSPEPSLQVGFATGFLVSPTLLLTNHHVFEDASAARGSGRVACTRALAARGRL